MTTQIGCSAANTIDVSTLLEYLGGLVDKRMQEPKDDIISQLVTQQIKPGNLDKADAVQMAFLLLVAGNATMVNMIALVSLACGVKGQKEDIINVAPRAS